MVHPYSYVFLATSAESAGYLIGATLFPLLLLCAAAPSSPSQSPHTSQEFIFTSAPFPSAHASTIVELRNGDLLAAWFGGTAEGAPDTAIWASRRTANQWSAPYLLVREPNVPCWNPVLFHSSDGRLWLYYKFGPNARTWTGARLVSNDEAHTWSPPDHLPAGLLGPIKDKPLVLPDGTIVSGTSVESYSSWALWIDRSTDNGITWTKFGPITVPTQPQPAVSADGEHFKIFANLEDQPGEYSYPAIIQGKAGELDITYTWNRKRIRFATVPLANIPGAP